MWMYVFIFLAGILWSGIAGSDDNFVQPFEEPPDCFKEATSFYIPPAVYTSWNFSTSSPTHIIICLAVYSHPTDTIFSMRK